MLRTLILQRPDTNAAINSTTTTGLNNNNNGGGDLGGAGAAGSGGGAEDAETASRFQLLPERDRDAADLVSRNNLK